MSDDLHHVPPGSMIAVNAVMSSRCMHGIDNAGREMGVMVKVVLAAGPVGSDSPDELLTVVMSQAVALHLAHELDHRECGG